MAAKRKSSGHNKAVEKRTKKDTILSADEIKDIGKKVQEEGKYNDIVRLLDEYTKIKEVLIDREDEGTEGSGRQLTVSLHQIFKQLFEKNLLRPSQDKKKEVLVKWLIDKYDSFKGILQLFLITKLSYKSSLQLDCVDTLLKLLKIESETMDSLYFATHTYNLILDAIFESQDFILAEFQSKFSKYYDLQYYFYQYLVDDFNPRHFSTYYTLIKEAPVYTENPKKIKSLKTLVKNVPTALHKPSNFKKHYQESLLKVLESDLSNDNFKSLLLILNKRVLPYLVQPSRLMDFLTDCYNNEDLIVKILALNSLYELMKKYNLEYPDFFTKLYSLLTPDLLYNRYRSRFFRLMDLFLSSTHLSSNLVASFIKRLARLSITAPAPGTVIVIPFIYNLLKRHPACMIMIQNSDNEDYVDPFDPEEKNPIKSGAIGSSLWELEALMNHYHPNVSTLAKIYTEPFRKPQYNLEDFLDLSFKSLVKSEQTKRYRTMAALEYDSWDQLVGESGFLEGWAM